MESNQAESNVNLLADMFNFDVHLCICPEGIAYDTGLALQDAKMFTYLPRGDLSYFNSESNRGEI